EREHDDAVPGLGIALGDGGECRPKGPIDCRITDYQPASCREERTLRGEGRAGGNVGVSYARVGTDQEHTRAETVEAGGKGRRLGLPDIHQPADLNGATNMRADQAHARARLAVDEATRFMPRDNDRRAAR